MKVGGNKAMRDFFVYQGFPSTLTIEQKYNSEAAGLYRDKIRALSEGGNPKPIPKIGWRDDTPTPSTVKKSNSQQGTGSSSLNLSRGGGGGGGGGDDDDEGGQFNYTASRPKMQGFGSSPAPSAASSAASSQSDWFNSLSSVLSTTAQMTSKAATEAATLVASKSKEAATLIAHKSTDAAHTLSTKDIGGTVANTWGGLTSFVGSAYSQVVTTVAGGDEGDGLGELKNRMGAGGPAGGGAKYEGMSSEAFTGFGGDEGTAEQTGTGGKGKKGGDDGWGGWDQDVDEKVNVKAPPARTPAKVLSPTPSRGSSSIRPDPLPSVDGGFGGWEEDEGEVEVVKEAVKGLSISGAGKSGADRASPQSRQENGKMGAGSASPQPQPKKKLVTAAPLEDDGDSGWDNDW